MMQVAIPHDLGREEVRQRLRTRSHELGDAIPGGLAQIATSWASEDRLDVTVTAMGQVIAGHIDIRDTEVEIMLTLPPALGFIEPIVEGAVRQKGRALLAPPAG